MTEEINKDDEATNEVNAPEPTDEESSEEESSSEEENLEESEESDEVEEKPEVKSEEIEEDYLDDEKTEPDYKKRYGDSTRENQTIRDKNKNLTLAIENLDKLSALNPKIAAEIEAAQKMSGASLDSSSTAVQEKIDKALEPISKVAQEMQNKERLSKVKIFANFEKRNPKLFSPKATEKEKTAIRQRIGIVTNALVKSGNMCDMSVK